MSGMEGLSVCLSQRCDDLSFSEFPAIRDHGKCSDDVPFCLFNVSHLLAGRNGCLVSLVVAVLFLYFLEPPYQIEQEYLL